MWHEEVTGSNPVTSIVTPSPDFMAWDIITSDSMSPQSTYSAHCENLMILELHDVADGITLFSGGNPALPAR
ncbi:hypothetical protein TNCV_3559971 [Trichonephila clavipes]|uniref:Uncharacterized protein n=1 Tax=Trichonephila clavipes TaxID=2585209 RepID=A0A8X6WDN6_TRICX|nr:hypothetical protein TNCV_3559971 [Trichonephila clavipes]